MCFTGAEFAILSAVVSAAGTIASGQAQAQQMEYNAQLAEINARTERQKGEAQQEQLAEQQRRLEGQQRVAALKSGVDPGAGSAANVIAYSAQQSWLDQAMTGWNAETAATGYENKAKDLRAQASAVKTGSYISAAGSILGGMGKSKYIPTIS